MKKIGEVAAPQPLHPEVAALVKEAHRQGIEPGFVQKVINAAETHEDTIADLTGLTRVRKPVPKLKPLPHRERVLDPHEETIFEETMAGEHQPHAVP